MTTAVGIPVGLVAARPLVAADALPAFGDAWAPVDCMRPDFVAGVEVTHTVPATRGDAWSGAATVRALAGRCRRSFEVVLGAQAPGDCAALLASLRRLTQAPCSVPLWSEAAELSAPVFGGFQDYAECDPSWRLFAQGQRVLIVDAEAQSGPYGASAYPDRASTPRRGMAWPYFEVHTVAVDADGGSIRDDRLVFDTQGGLNPLQRSFRAGARVVPLLDVERLDLVEADAITGRHWRGRVALRERSPTAATAAYALGADPNERGPFVPPMLAFGAAPEDSVTVDSLPLLDLRGQPGARAGFVRASRDGAASGARAFERFGVDLVASSRARARRLLQLFEGRGGMTLPFFAALPGERLRLAPSASGGTTVSGTTLDVERTGWETREAPEVFGAAGGLPEWVVVEHDDGAGGVARTARRVTARADTTHGSGKPVERLTLHEALPTIARSAVRGVFFAGRVRFGSDSVTERWMGGRHARSSFTLEEALDERSVQVGAVRDPGTACAHCLMDSGEDCPGSASWPGEIPAAAEGSDEAAACALDAGNDLVLAEGATIRVAGSMRIVTFEACGFPVVTNRVSRFVEAGWDADLPRDASVYPASDRWRLDTGPRELSAGAGNHHRWLGPLSTCTGPTFLAPGSGAAGVVAARGLWRNARAGGGSRLLARVVGLREAGDDFEEEALWYAQVEALGDGSFTVGGGIGATSFSPAFVPWSAAVLSRTGVTAMAASFLVDYGDGGRAEFTLTAHVCPVYACAESE